jgi:hypothetical protein
MLMKMPEPLWAVGSESCKPWTWLVDAERAARVLPAVLFEPSNHIREVGMFDGKARKQYSDKNTIEACGNMHSTESFMFAAVLAICNARSNNSGRHVLRLNSHDPTLLGFLCTDAASDLRESLDVVSREDEIAASIHGTQRERGTHCNG